MRLRTALAMSVALVPLRLATVMVTPGYCAARCREPLVRGAEEHVVGGIGGPVDDLVRNIAQIDRPAMIDADNHGLEILCGR